MWDGFKIRSTEDLNVCLNDFRILFAYNSAKIENAEVTLQTTSEIFNDGTVKLFSGRPDTLTEIDNQRKCHSFLLPHIVAKNQLSLDLIKETHEVTTMGTYDDRRFFVLDERPGEFKKNDFVVGPYDVGSLPDTVEADMQELLDEMAEVQLLNRHDKVLKAATYFHTRFEYIHPFADGNGRVGRSLMNYLLMIHNHPPITVFDEDKAQYYEALVCYVTNEDIEPLYVFFQQQLEKTWCKTFEH